MQPSPFFTGGGAPFAASPIAAVRRPFPLAERRATELHRSLPAHFDGGAPRACRPPLTRSPRCFQDRRSSSGGFGTTPATMDMRFRGAGPIPGDISAIGASGMGSSFSGNNGWTPGLAPTPAGMGCASLSSCPCSCASFLIREYPWAGWARSRRRPGRSAPASVREPAVTVSPSQPGSQAALAWPGGGGGYAPPSASMAAPRPSMGGGA
eukprot:COSAG04_NODE_3081_length_3189_cov_2.765372_4_plen_208_part_01